MKNHEHWASSYLVFLVAAIFFLPTLAGTRDDSLRAELRGNDNKQPIFRPDYRNDIHFLLFSTRDGTRVFQEWCSWGYFTRTFTAKQVGGKAKEYAIKRNPNQVWTGKLSTLPLVIIMGRGCASVLNTPVK